MVFDPLLKDLKVQFLFLRRSRVIGVGVLNCCGSVSSVTVVLKVKCSKVFEEFIEEEMQE